ncbi:MAG: 30S ribosomal protein S24e [Candidatus Thorarchaeota archaeon]
MEIEIVRERLNSPLNRRELEFKIEHAGQKTPSRADVKSKLVGLLNADPSCLVITEMRTMFGIGRTTGSARLYFTPEAVKKIEQAHILRRHEPKKKEGEAE